VGETGGRPQFMPLEWPWFPLINHYADHPITRNLDATLTRFISSMDTVKASGVKKTPLLFTSSYSHKTATPVKIDINAFRKQPKAEDFRDGPVPVAYLLEGEFTSLYKNRFLPAGADTSGVLQKSKPTKIIVVADGDLARNEVNPRSGQAQALGFDPVSGYTFANADLLSNMVAYLVEENGVISARNKQVKIRPLDKEQLKDRTYWQALNLVLPLVVLVAFGLARAWTRKRKYASF
jgi:ABC-2 type transport system permease protein